MARRRDPKVVQLLKGETRPSRLHDEPEFEPSDGLEAPYLRDDVAEEVWSELVGILEEHRVLTMADRRMLAQLCNMESASVQKWKAGTPPSAADQTQLRMFYTEFGLTPASRSKVSSGGSDRKKSAPFSNVG